jgi:hypothetical protein
MSRKPSTRAEYLGPLNEEQRATVEWLRAMVRAACLVTVIGCVAATAEAQRLERLSPADSFVLTIGERVPGHLRGARDAHTVPVIQVRTSRVYSCLLDLSLTAAGSPSHPRLSINGIEDVGACPAAMGPAAGAVALTVADGVDTLDVTAEGRIDQYMMHVTDSSLRVTPARSSFTQFDSAELQRAPRNSMAFYCVRHQMDAESDRRERRECADFVQLLVDSLGVSEFTFAGTGRIPFSLRSDLKREELRYFRYRRPEDFATMYDLLQRFSRVVLSARVSHAMIELANWRGSLISSYRCAPWQGCESIPGRPRW